MILERDRDADEESESEGEREGEGEEYLKHFIDKRIVEKC